MINCGLGISVSIDSGTGLHLFNVDPLSEPMLILFSFKPLGRNTLWCFPCLQPEQSAEQTVELRIIWHTMTLM